MTLVLLVVCAEWPHPAAAAPPDPASGGEWLAFAAVKLPPALGEDATAACRGLLSAVLTDAVRLAVSPTNDGIEELVKSVAAAGPGRPVSIWLFPAGAAGREPKVSTSPPAPSAADRASLSAAATEWASHRASVDAARPGLPAAIEVAVNLNEVRQAFEAGFDLAAGEGGGRGARVLHAMGLSNARVVGLHIRFVEPARVVVSDPSLPKPAGDRGGRVGVGANYNGPALAVVDVTWSARSEPPGRVHRLGLTMPYWPAAQLGGGPPEGVALAAAFRASWRPQFERAMRLYAACLSPTQAEGFAREVSVWAASTKPDLNRLLTTIDPWVGAGLAGDGAARIVVETRLREGASAEVTARAFDGVLRGLLAPAGAAEEAGKRSWSIVQPAAGWWVRGCRWTLVNDRPRPRLTVRVELSGPPAPR